MTPAQYLVDRSVALLAHVSERGPVGDLGHHLGPRRGEVFQPEGDVLKRDFDYVKYLVNSDYAYICVFVGGVVGLRLLAVALHVAGRLAVGGLEEIVVQLNVFVAVLKAFPNQFQVVEHFEVGVEHEPVVHPGGHVDGAKLPAGIVLLLRHVLELLE